MVALFLLATLYCFHLGSECLDHLPRLHFSYIPFYLFSLQSLCLGADSSCSGSCSLRISFRRILAFFLCGGFWGADRTPSQALSPQGDMDPCTVSLSSPDSCLLKYPSAGELQHPASEFIGFLSPKGADPRNKPSTRGIAFNGEKAYIKLNSVRKAWSELRSSICASPLFPGKFISEVEFTEGCGARSEDPKLSSDGRSGQVFTLESRYPPFESTSDRTQCWKIQGEYRMGVGSQGKGQARMGREMSENILFNVSSLFSSSSLITLWSFPALFFIEGNS